MLKIEEYQKITERQQEAIRNYFKKMAEPFKEEIKELETLKNFVESVRIPVYCQYSADIPFIDVLNSLVKAFNFFPSTNNQLVKELTILRDKLKDAQDRIVKTENSLGFVASELSKDFSYDREDRGSFHDRIEAIRNLNWEIKQGYFSEEQQREMASLFGLAKEVN